MPNNKLVEDKRKSKERDNGKWSGYGKRNTYVNLEPNKDEQGAIKSWDVTGDDVFDAIQRMVEADYSITCCYDNKNKCIAVFCNPRGDDHRHSGLALTARGSSVFKAMKQLVWKHFEALKEDWTTHIPQYGGFDIDD